VQLNALLARQQCSIDNVLVTVLLTPLHHASPVVLPAETGNLHFLGYSIQEPRVKLGTLGPKGDLQGDPLDVSGAGQQGVLGMQSISGQ
jgi:hypothetical protein